MKTHLEDRHNNKQVVFTNDGQVNISAVIDSIKFRILKHREYITKHKKTILENIDYPNIVQEAVENILERKAKIGELEELIKYSLLAK